MNRNLAIIWAFTLVVLIFQAWSTYGSLPDRIPSHFNFQGEPNGYSTKQQFYATWIFTMALLNILMPAVNLVLKFVPPGMINVPHREYWLATPERKRQMVAKMTNLMVSLAVAMNIMFFLIFESIRSYVLTGSASIPMWLPLAIVPFVIVIPMIFLFRTFRVPTSIVN